MLGHSQRLLGRQVVRGNALMNVTLRMGLLRLRRMREIVTHVMLCVNYLLIIGLLVVCVAVGHGLVELRGTPVGSLLVEQLLRVVVVWVLVCHRLLLEHLMLVEAFLSRFVLVNLLRSLGGDGRSYVVQH